MKIFVDSDFMTVSEDRGVLTLKWKEGTSNFTDQKFKDSALKFISAVRESGTKSILVDMRDFSFELSPEIIEWRNENVISVYNDIGVEKFAFVTNDPPINQNNPANTFITRHFSSSDEAVVWLMGEE